MHSLSFVGYFLFQEVKITYYMYAGYVEVNIRFTPRCNFLVLCQLFSGVVYEGGGWGG